MAAITVRKLDDDVKERLRVRAAIHGRSMESEVRDILTKAVQEPSPDSDLFTALAERFGALGGVDLDIPPRESMPPAPEFD